MFEFSLKKKKIDFFGPLTGTLGGSLLNFPLRAANYVRLLSVVAINVYRDLQMCFNSVLFHHFNGIK